MLRLLWSLAVITVAAGISTRCKKAFSALGKDHASPLKYLKAVVSASSGRECIELAKQDRAFVAPRSEAVDWLMRAAEWTESRSSSTKSRACGLLESVKTFHGMTGGARAMDAVPIPKDKFLSQCARGRNLLGRLSKVNRGAFVDAFETVAQSKLLVGDWAAKFQKFATESMSKAAHLEGKCACDDEEGFGSAGTRLKGNGGIRVRFDSGFRAGPTKRSPSQGETRSTLIYSNFKILQVYYGSRAAAKNPSAESNEIANNDDENKNAKCDRIKAVSRIHQLFEVSGNCLKALKKGVTYTIAGAFGEDDAGRPVFFINPCAAVREDSEIEAQGFADRQFAEVIRNHQVCNFDAQNPVAGKAKMGGYLERHYKLKLAELRNQISGWRSRLMLEIDHCRSLTETIMRRWGALVTNGVKPNYDAMQMNDLSNIFENLVSHPSNPLPEDSPYSYANNWSMDVGDQGIPIVPTEKAALIAGIDAVLSSQNYQFAWEDVSKKAQQTLVSWGKTSPKTALDTDIADLLRLAVAVGKTPPKDVADSVKKIKAGAREPEAKGEEDPPVNNLLDLAKLRDDAIPAAAGRWRTAILAKIFQSLVGRPAAEVAARVKFIVAKEFGEPLENVPAVLERGTLANVDISASYFGFSCRCTKERLPPYAPPQPVKGTAEYIPWKQAKARFVQEQQEELCIIDTPCPDHVLPKFEEPRPNVQAAGVRKGKEMVLQTPQQVVEWNKRKSTWYERHRRRICLDEQGVERPRPCTQAEMQTSCEFTACPVALPAFIIDPGTLQEAIGWQTVQGLVR